MKDNDAMLAHVRVSRQTIAEIRKGGTVTGILRPKRRSDGQGPSEAVFEPVAPVRAERDGEGS